MSSLIGTYLGTYRITGRVGRGGMASVFKAYHEATDRDVAIKVLPELYAHDPDYLARFEREAKLVASLQHIHILPLFDYGREAEITYLVMPYVATGTLKQHLTQGRPDISTSIHLITQVADALAYAHSMGVLHRDIKPDNILIDASGNALLSDFGIARQIDVPSELTADNIVGTPAYMAPEQAQSGLVDERADVYSLGVVLYEMTTGTVPYHGDTPLAVIMKHLNDALPSPSTFNPEVPQALEAVLFKALAKEPTQRHQTASELGDAIKIVIGDEQDIDTGLTLSMAPWEVVTGSEKLSTRLLHQAAVGITKALVDQDNDTLALKPKLEAAATQGVIRQALSRAIQRYGTVDRLVLARPLVTEAGLLTRPAILEVLAQALPGPHEPDLELFGTQWKDAIENPPVWRDFSDQAHQFIELFRDELSNTTVFQTVFEDQSLDSLKMREGPELDSQVTLDPGLGSFMDMMNTPFNDLASSFLHATYSIRNHIRDFSRYIEEKTRDFVGRSFVFEAVETFIDTHPRGYFFVRGDPGIGKSAIAAYLVKTHGYLHHFNIRAEGITRASDFLRNICAQLIAAYGLDHITVPPEAMQEGTFFHQLLDEVAAKLDGNKCVILVDALDEAEIPSTVSGTNILYLPVALPEGIFVVATTRREDIPLRIDIPEQGTLDIQQDDADNLADIVAYIEHQLDYPGVQDYIARHEIDNELFVDHIAEKSQGNFIYLRMVMPEIVSGAYSDLDLTEIPLGLQSYYEDHWRRIRWQSELDWFDYKLPIVVALTVIKESVSIDLISEFSYIDDRRRIRAVLRDFEQFLYKAEVEHEGSTQRRYRWYHGSFFDFIAGKEDIADERVDLTEGNRKIADLMWSDLFDE